MRYQCVNWNMKSGLNLPARPASQQAKQVCKRLLCPIPLTCHSQFSCQCSRSSRTPETGAPNIPLVFDILWTTQNTSWAGVVLLATLTALLNFYILATEIFPNLSSCLSFLSAFLFASPRDGVSSPQHLYYPEDVTRQGQSP
jgi:hypothetical protein